MGLVARKPRSAQPLFGYLAEFADGASLLRACERARAAGYSRLEAYTPLPMHEVSQVLGYRNRLPLLVLLGGAVGAVLGFGMQYYSSVESYPLNVGGRPLNSWPAFVVVTFELTILCAALTAVLGMLALNGLPRPHHPVFAVPAFELASRNRFFLLILAHDPRFDAAETQAFLAGMDSLAVLEVPNA
jgi:hypothetical protein